MSLMKNMIAQAVFTTAVDRLTKAAKKNGLDRDEFTAVVDAIRQKHYPAKLDAVTLTDKPASGGSFLDGRKPS